MPRTLLRWPTAVVGLSLLAVLLSGCAEEPAVEKRSRGTVREEIFYSRTGSEWIRTGRLIGAYAAGADGTRPPPGSPNSYFLRLPQDTTNLTVNLTWAPDSAPERMWLALLAREVAPDISGRMVARYTVQKDVDGPSQLSLTHSAEELWRNSLRLDVEVNSDCVCNFEYRLTAHFMKPDVRIVRE